MKLSDAVKHFHEKRDTMHFEDQIAWDFIHARLIEPPVCVDCRACEECPEGVRRGSLRCRRVRREFRKVELTVFN